MARGNKANRDAFVSIPAEVKEMLRYVIPAVQQMPKIDRIDGAGAEMRKASFSIIREFYMAYYARTPEKKAEHVLEMFGWYGHFIAAFEVAIRQGILKDGFKLPTAFLLSHCLLNFIGRPQFIAYRIGYRPPTVRLAELFGALRFGWTSHEPRNEKGRDGVIFEFYKPRVKFK